MATDRSPGGADSLPSATSTPHPTESPSTPGRGQALLVTAGAALGALLAWGLGETPIVRVPPQQSNLVVMGQVTQTVATTAEAIQEADRLTAIRSLAAFGALVGLALGAAGGVFRRSRRAAVKAGALGMLLGGGLGAVSPLGALPLLEAIRTPGTQDLLPSLTMHLALWIPSGLAAGLAFGVGKGESKGGLIASAGAGACGAALGAVAFQLLGTLAFPMAGVEKVLAATPISRLFGRLIVALGIGLLVGRAAGGGRQAGRASG
ncbi:hypothetical protein [Tautonia sociabilis]|uniref:Uncharacterized protein n=1 Tax=Tautonia sociabilis TaxID=2080755 RepID=A0A432ML30_9BACT|nr:hypothetical protein [Tautonia sociabilis]RUL88134.1 hypothetical protein TsocGM_08305 [Tautonia sociabilis]